MASNGSDSGGLLSAGGILSIVAGISQIIGGVSLAVIVLFPDYLRYSQFKMLFLPFLPDAWVQYILWGSGPILFGYGVYGILRLIIGGCVVVLGILGVVGGISAIKRKRFSLSLAGGVSALLSGILGILAVIFVALGKREFGAERKENGI